MESQSRSIENTDDKPLFVSLLTANYYKLHGFILTMVPNRTDAEDVLQNTIMYLWEHFSDFKPGTNFLAWAVTIAKFQILTYRKKMTRSKVHLSEKVLDLIALENEKLSSQADVRYEALQKCLKKLPETDMNFLKKRFMQGSSVKKLSEEVGISLQAVYARLSKLKSILLECIRRTLATQGIG